MKRASTEKLKELLAAVKLRRTKARMAVLNGLLEAGGPCSADEIHSRLGKTGPDRVTVYRVLERFVEAGLVHRAFVQKRTWYYEMADKCSEEQCHPHFTCSGCGLTHCLPGMSMPMAQSRYKGFVIQHQQVRLEGLCPQCV